MRGFLLALAERWRSVATASAGPLPAVVVPIETAGQKPAVNVTPAPQSGLPSLSPLVA